MIPTVPKTNSEVTNLCNLVTVEIYSRGLSLRVKGNSGVGRLPVDAVRDSGVHLLFDFAHDAWVVWYVRILRGGGGRV